MQLRQLAEETLTTSTSVKLSTKLKPSHAALLLACDHANLLMISYVVNVGTNCIAPRRSPRHWRSPVQARHDKLYFVTILRVGVTVLAGAVGEIENVPSAFPPTVRLPAHA
jgi:hypothetical protein